jgi:hypothetical protein
MSIVCESDLEQLLNAAVLFLEDELDLDRFRFAISENELHLLD